MRCNICKKNNHETFDCFFRFKTGIRTKRKQGEPIQKTIAKRIKIDERNSTDKQKDQLKLPTSLAHQTADKKETTIEAHEYMFAPMKRPKRQQLQHYLLYQLVPHQNHIKPPFQPEVFQRNVWARATSQIISI